MLFLFALFNILTLICCKKDVFLYEECDNEICNWYKNSRFVGCIDKHVLRFSYFDTTSSIDLTCASVRQIFIQSEFDCKDVPSIIENAKNVPIVFVGDDETQCIISPSSHMLTKETVPDQTMGHIKSSPDHAMGHVTSNPGQTMGYVTSGPDQAMGHVMSSPAQTMKHVTSSPDNAMGYIASSSGDGMVHMSSQHVSIGSKQCSLTSISDEIAYMYNNTIVTIFHSRVK
eukprot:XP_019920111.1 PREDICTED: uncharacterized protein LOC105321441 [Crassostrea gigas]